HRQVVERFLDQVRVLFPDVAELGRGDAHEQHSALGMAIARGLQPRLIRMPIDLFFQRIEDAHPRIRGSNGGRTNGHSGPVIEPPLWAAFPIYGTDLFVWVATRGNPRITPTSDCCVPAGHDWRTTTVGILARKIFRATLIHATHPRRAAHQNYSLTLRQVRS